MMLPGNLNRNAEVKTRRIWRSLLLLLLLLLIACLPLTAAAQSLERSDRGYVWRHGKEYVRFDRGRWSAGIAVGGMNHFLLAGDGQARADDLKYGVNAMELLINKVLRAGGERRALQAKLFGGARMTDHARDIGQSNALFALEFLDREGIPCISQSLGGQKARRIQFTPSTGAARQLQVSGPAPDLSPLPAVLPPPAPITLF